MYFKYPVAVRRLGIFIFSPIILSLHCFNETEI
uniref:Uncharacterized protein n=1 Tax=Siphoviridae sp. ctNDP2 TaxID=2826265 RepID=A0A8S5NDZ9_9CAUD|nr:MAG TPA: hypothetical protein [Siphoviridae sp. ctNDP2]